MIEGWEWPWLAALIDGEGSIMLNKRTFSGNTSQTTKRTLRTPFRAVVSVYNTNYLLFEKLTETFPDRGRVYQHRVNGSPPTPRKRAAWSWRLANNGIRWALPQVRPYLVLKTQQADLLLEALEIKNTLTPQLGETWLTKDQRHPLVSQLEIIYAEIRRLNTVGRTVLPENGE